MSKALFLNVEVLIPRALLRGRKAHNHTAGTRVKAIECEILLE